ncbi:MAG TPA: GSCFA domain-containing protein [Rhizobium sp.]|nr:GSCFA domain-containing protein [Rhizobium sp.]
MATFTYEQDGEVKKASGSFFRGNSINFHPSNNSLSRSDFVAEYLMKGWTPPTKFVKRETPIVAFGSCFAANISNYLHARGYNVLTKRDNKAYITNMGDGIVNSFAILQQFEWAWLNKRPEADLWHGYKAEEFGYEESVRLDTKELLDHAELFIITLGLSEIWYDEQTGEVFWRAVPKEKYDPSRHKFRVATHAETLANLNAIYAIIRQFRPDSHILFSVSPIPLTATFRAVSCLTADAVSKAILRSALDEFLRLNSGDQRVHYMPSYEGVTRLFNNQWSVDRRHVHPHVLNFNMQMFECFFCDPGITQEELAHTFQQAREEDVRIGSDGHVHDGLSYMEIRQQKIEAKREARRQARIAARAQARAEEREKLAPRRPDRYLLVKNAMTRAAALIMAAALGFAVNGFFDLSLALE